MVVKLRVNLSLNSESFRAGLAQSPHNIICEILPFSSWQRPRIEFKLWNWKEKQVAQLPRSIRQGTAEDRRSKADKRLAKMKFIDMLLAGKSWFDKLQETVQI